MKFLTAHLGRIFLLAPSYGWLFFAIFAPLLIMLGFSFLSDVPIGARAKDIHLTIENYQIYFSKSFYWTLTQKSLLTALYTTLLCIFIGYPTAYAIAKAVPGKWKTALFMLVIIPLWSNTLVRIYSWGIVLRDGGTLNLFLKALGFPEGSFSILYSYPAVIVGLVHGYLPFMTLAIYISLDRLDDTLLEAAASLGAKKWQTFFRVTLPLSLPGVVAGTIMTFIPVMGSFVEPRILGGKQGTMIGTVIEDQFIQLFNWPFGSAVAFLLLVIVLMLMGVPAFVSRKTNRMTVGGG